MRSSIFKTILTLLCLCQCQVAPAAGQDKRHAPAAPVQSNRKHSPGRAERPAEDAALRERRLMATEALGTLITENISSIPESSAERLYSLTDLASQSALLLWKYDTATANGHFQKLSQTLLDLYEKDRRQKADSERLAYERRSVKRVITLWSTKDAGSAVKLQTELHEIDKELGAETDTSRTAERVELAGELLDSDPQQSASLAERIIETSFPSTFPDYLHKLRQIDPAAAARLLSKSLAVLATGQVYSFRHDLNIQAYVFKEPMIVFPINEPVDVPGFKSLVYPAGGVYVLKYSLGARDVPDPAECVAYLNASLSGIEKKFQRSTSLNGLDAATAYFLLQKQSAFFRMGRTRSPAPTAGLLQASALFATNKGVNEANLNHLAAAAGEAAARNFLDFLKRTASTAAEQTEDASVKAVVLEKDIFGDLEADRFDSAAVKISRLDDREAREAFSDYLHVLLTRNAAKSSDWDAVDTHLERISNPSVKTYALLECARFALAAKNRPKWSQYLQAARRIAEEKLSVKEQPQMMAGLLLTFAEGHATNSEELPFTTLADVLYATTRDINRRLEDEAPVEPSKSEQGVFAAWYVGNDVGLSSRGVAGGAIRYQLQGTSLERAFAEAAKIDWLTTYTAAQDLKDRSLRGRAILGVCRVVL